VAAEWNKTVERGDHWVIQFHFTDAAVPPNRLSIAGYEFWYTAKPAIDADATDAAAIIKLDPADFTLDSTLGDATIDRMTALVTEAMTTVVPATYLHDLQVKVGGRITTYCKGQLVIGGDVTRRVA
jgi:hypothetical protein